MVLVGPVIPENLSIKCISWASAAIVAEAGTTRDIVEVRLDIDGISVILKDTAGIREQAGQVETIGIERARQAADGDLVILLADGSHEHGMKKQKPLRKMSQRQ